MWITQRLDVSLVIKVPDDRHQVDKDKNPIMTLKSDLIICMICIHITSNLDSLNQCFCCIRSYFFLDVTIKLETLGLLIETFSKIILHVF